MLYSQTKPTTLAFSNFIFNWLFFDLSLSLSLSLVVGAFNFSRATGSENRHFVLFFYPISSFWMYLFDWVATDMVGPSRPQFVLFGSSITQFSFANGGWGAILADVYARKVTLSLFSSVFAFPGFVAVENFDPYANFLMPTWETALIWLFWWICFGSFPIVAFVICWIPEVKEDCTCEPFTSWIFMILWKHNLFTVIFFKFYLLYIFVVGLVKWWPPTG